MIQSFHFLDQSDVLLKRVAFPLQLYLFSREDTVRIIISGLLSDTALATKPGNDKLVELALLLGEGSGVGRADDQELDWNDMSWEPDPVDAGPGYKRSKTVDIIGTLISCLGSQDVFIKEFQHIIAENLLKHDGAFEKEVSIHKYYLSVAMLATDKQQIKVLELLKARFGEAPLQSCEVMLKDIQDSVRVNSTIRYTQDLGLSTSAINPDATTLNAKILSRLFWPQLQDESFNIPTDIEDLQTRYEEGFESIKTARKLTWLPALGYVTVQLDLEDRIIVEEVLPFQATVINAFSSPSNEEMRTVTQLTVSLRMSETLVRSALKFWCQKLVLQEMGRDVFAVLETLNSADKSRAAKLETGTAGQQEEQQVHVQGIPREKEAMYWQFISAMLTNSSSQSTLR